jgi:hypothetical protein
MAEQLPTFAPSVVGAELSSALDQHRAAIAGTIAAPSAGLLYRTMPDGSIVDRSGMVVHPAPKP